MTMSREEKKKGDGGGRFETERERSQLM